MLGNGRQRKSYLYVQDCIDAMLTAIEKSQDKVNVFNLGTDGSLKTKPDAWRATSYRSGLTRRSWGHTGLSKDPRSRGCAHRRRGSGAHAR